MRAHIQVHNNKKGSPGTDSLQGINIFRPFLRNIVAGNSVAAMESTTHNNDQKVAAVPSISGKAYDLKNTKNFTSNTGG